MQVEQKPLHPPLCLWGKLTPIGVYLLFHDETMILCIGYKSGEHFGQPISESSLTHRETKKLVVAFVECDSTLLWINMILRRLDKGRSSSHGSSTGSSSLQYVLEVNSTPSRARMGPTIVLSILLHKVDRPPPLWCRSTLSPAVLAI